MWYRDMRYPQVFRKLTVSRRDPRGLGHHTSTAWWLDSGATIHACYYEQSMTSRKSPTSQEQYVYTGGTKVHVFFFSFFKFERLQCSKENFIDLHDVACIPSIWRNLIFVPILDRLRYIYIYIYIYIYLYFQIYIWKS